MKSALPNFYLETKAGKLKKAGIIYQDILASLSSKPGSSHELVNEVIKQFEMRFVGSEQERKRAIGDVFEMVVAENLFICGLLPFYAQATFINIPGTKYDFVLYNQEFPVVISTKFSLGDRWKHDAQESSAIKNVYNQSEYYLVSNNKADVASKNRKIKSKEIQTIDRVILASDGEWSAFLDSLAKRTNVKGKEFGVAEKVDPIEGNVISKQTVID